MGFRVVTPALRRLCRPAQAVNREQRRLPPLLRGHNEMCPDCPSQAITADGQLTQLEIGTSVVTYYGEIVELKETDTHE